MKPFNLDEYLANPSRKVVTRNGKPVIIHCTNYESDGPIIAEVKGYNKSRSYQRNGRYYLYDDSNYDLFFASEKYERWVNVFKSISSGNYMGTFIFKSKKEAKEDVKDSSNCIATIKIEWED